MLKRFFQPPVFPGDDVKTLQARLLSTTVNFFLAMLVMVILGDLIGGGVPAATIAIDVIGILIFLAERYALQRGYITQVGLLTIGAGFVLITLAVISLGTIRNPSTSYYIISIIMAGLLFRRRGWLVMAGASSAAIAALIVAENAGWITPAISGVSITQWFTFTTVFILAGAIVVTTAEIVNDATQRASAELTERRRAVEAMLSSETKFRSLVEQSLDGIVIANASGEIVVWNQALAEIMDLPVEETLGRLIWDVQYESLPPGRKSPERYQQIKEQIQQGLARGEPFGPREPMEISLVTPKGVQKAIESINFMIKVQDEFWIASILRDISERKTAEQRLREVERRLRLTLEAAHVVAWEIEPETGRMHDIGPVDELFGESDGFYHADMQSWLAKIHPEDRERVQAAMQAAVKTGSEYNVEYRLASKDGVVRWIEATGQRIDDEPGRPVRLLGAARDISERKWAEEALNEVNEELLARVWDVEQLQQALREQAIRDPLSGLYNRWFLDEALRQEFARAHRDNSRICLIMMDIDHFKELNDTYGHLTGDAVISQIGARLKNACREGDIVCRFGGEEFVMVLPDMSPEAALGRAEKVRAFVQADDFEVGGKRLRVAISAGVAIYPLHADNPVELIQAADTALYRAKASGRNCTVLCES